MATAIVYSLGSYYYLKHSTVKALQMESLNRAYYVTKQMSAIYDRVAHEYRKREIEMYQALNEAQAYFKANGPHAPLDVLRRKLMEGREGSIYNVYLINNNYIIENTTFQPDLGLDFKELPVAHKILQGIYGNPETIDLSPVIYDAVGIDFKRYVVQRAIDGEYMVQLGLSLDRALSLQQAVSELQKSVPKLVSSSAYQIFTSSAFPYSVEKQWSMEYSSMSKQECVNRHDDDLELFKRIMAPMMRSPVEQMDQNSFSRHLSDMFEKEHFRATYFSRDGHHVHRVVMPFFSYLKAYDQSINLLVMDFDESEAEHTLQMMNVVVGILWVLLFLMSVTVVWLMRYRVAGPLAMIQGQMKEKKAVEHSMLRVRSDEISDMAAVYNQLLADLNREIRSNEELLEQFRTFTANAIHQIRTPVSVMKIALEMIDTPNEEAMLQIKASLISIEHMYDSLSYTLQQESIDFPSERLDLSVLLEARIALFSVVAAAHDSKIRAEIESDIAVQINLTEAEYLIDNNLSNAIKYGTPKEPISVKLHRSGNEIVLSIESMGKPIKDTKVIFERYHRDDASRRGSGIGLHMVEVICERNHILIQVDSLGGKSRFTYYFPTI